MQDKFKLKEKMIWQQAERDIQVRFEERMKRSCDIFNNEVSHVKAIYRQLQHDSFSMVSTIKKLERIMMSQECQIQ